MNISDLVKMFKNLDFGQSFNEILVNNLKNLDFNWNLDFGHNFWKILILVTVFVKSRIWAKFSKLAILVEIDAKISNFCQNFGKSRNLSKFLENLNCVQKFLQNSDFVQNVL